MTSIINVVEDRKRYVTVLQSVTSDVTVVLRYADGRAVDTTKYKWGITNTSFIFIESISLPVGYYTVERYTALVSSWVTANKAAIPHLMRAYLQYLADIRGLQDTAPLVSALFSRRLGYILQDHTFSMQAHDISKPVRNPIYGPTIDPDETTEPYTYKSYFINTDVYAAKDANTGMGFISNTEYSVLASISGNMISLYKHFYNPLTESFTDCLWKMPNPADPIKVFLGDTVYTATVYSTSTGILTLQLPTTPSNTEGYLAISFNDYFIPMRIHFNRRRAFDVSQSDR